MASPLKEKVCVLMQPPFYPLPGILTLLEGRYTVLQMADLDAHTAPAVSALISCRAVDRLLLDTLPNLRIVANSGIGVEKIDLDLCRHRGIRVTNGAHVSVITDTADMAILLMLATLRRVCLAHRFVEHGSWSAGSSLPLARKTSSLHVGIVGLGRIGMEIAKRAVGLNSIVSYYGRTKKKDVPYAYFSNLIELAANSNVLIVACPLSKDTRHLIGKDVFDALGPEGTLINVARGPVVDELELCKALIEKRLGGAGLDVFEEEPSVSAELMRMDNVVLSPHCGGVTLETRAAVAQLIVNNINASLAGKPLLTPVV